MWSRQGHHEMLKGSDSLSLLYSKFTPKRGTCRHGYLAIIGEMPNMLRHQWEKGLKQEDSWGGGSCMRAAPWNREGIGRPHLPFSSSLCHDHTIMQRRTGRGQKK